MYKVNETDEVFDITLNNQFFSNIKISVVKIRYHVKLPTHLKILNNQFSLNIKIFITSDIKISINQDTILRKQSTHLKSIK